MKKLYNPVWKVYHYNFNAKKIEPYTLLGGEYGNTRFEDDIVKNLKKNKDDKEAFKEQLKKDLMYYYWSRTEYEVLISGWPPTKDNEEEIKIDIYDQVCLNFDVFADYIWNSVSHTSAVKTNNTKRDI